MKWLFALFILASVEQLATHIVYEHAKQESCRTTHNATQQEPWIELSCNFRCDRPVSDTFDAKTLTVHTECRGPLSGDK